ncbi:hypothetical protein KKD19_03475 [Patescibacteria group bacterium]|nr:hypothetical protein [Patescibacteria group bacterium]MCG2693276.1 hypothetical protein [Candidatus Parcubacteria bacterium]
MITKIKIFFFVGLSFFLMPMPISLAWQTTAHTEIQVFIEKDNNPYNQPVDFAITCYGYDDISHSSLPKFLLKIQKLYIAIRKALNLPAKIYSLQAHCPAYGCKIYDPLSVYSKLTEYCKFSSVINGNEIRVKKSVTQPSDFFSCETLGLVWFSGGDIKGEKIFMKDDEELPIDGPRVEKDSAGEPIERRCAFKIDISQTKK